MASSLHINSLPILPLLLLSSFLLLLTPSLSDIPPSTPVTPGAACNSTTDPAFCKSVLPPKGSQNLYTYSRFSLAKSLNNARGFLNAVNKYLSRRSALSTSAVKALEDCQLLAELNIDFLVSASSTVNSTSTSTLLDPQTDKLQTLLSALLTNQQTCVDGLQAAASAWSVKNGLSVPLSNANKLYSVSLSLFNRAWVKKKPKKSRNVSVPPKDVPVPPNARKLLRRGRRLLQSSDAVMVSDIVVVSQDGTGNFTNITDAVNSAPNNTDGSGGYYLILVSAGVYQEYVLIPKYKKYLMMIGDGINQTVVTGDHNNVDGWTTFNSATFAVVGQGFVAMNMTFQNTAGPAKHQAVAVRNGADLSAFYSCSFEGYQDTLYTHSMRHVLQELRRLRHGRLHLRQRRGGLPGVQHLLEAPHAGPEQHHHRPGPDRPGPEHGHVHPGLQRRGRARPRRGWRLDADVPGEAVEGVLEDGRHAVERRRPGPRHGVDAMEWGIRAEHAVLRRVQQFRFRVGHGRQGVLAGLPCHQQQLGRAQLHRDQLCLGGQLVASDWRAILKRIAVKYLFDHALWMI
ncbi:putative pectinesterase [Iris pallida]|uniref:pectinesterase n=1 Tax=Iris pallida TaxID=29817 RepID=A0AAX6IIJ2_IRIPA|nr:putative pectinesterase [Iris pallida]